LGKKSEPLRNGYEGNQWLSERRVGPCVWKLHTMTPRSEAPPENRREPPHLTLTLNSRLAPNHPFSLDDDDDRSLSQTLIRLITRIKSFFIRFVFPLKEKNTFFLFFPKL